MTSSSCCVSLYPSTDLAARTHVHKDSHAAIKALKLLLVRPINECDPSTVMKQRVSSYCVVSSVSVLCVSATFIHEW